MPGEKHLTSGASECENLASLFIPQDSADYAVRLCTCTWIATAPNHSIMIPPTSVLHREKLIKTSQIAFLTTTGTVMLNDLHNIMISLPSALTMESENLVTFSEQYALETARPLETSHVTNSTGVIFGAHEVIIIAVTVSIGLACAASLFAAVVKYGYRRKPGRQTMPTTRAAKNSLEICCIGIDSKKVTPPTKNIHSLLETNAPTGG